MSIQITDLMRTGRGLCASFDPAAGPERAAAFKADMEWLFTAPLPAPVVPPTTFKRGDQIRITIVATVEDPSTCDGLYYSYPAHYGTDYRLLRTDSPAVTVEHLPADPPPMERKPAPDRDKPGEIVDIAMAPIGELGLSARVHNCLRRWEIHDVGALLTYSEQQLTDIRNFGPNALDEVRRVLAAHGLELRS